jgi:hypothetical protein
MICKSESLSFFSNLKLNQIHLLCGSKVEILLLVSDLDTF